MRTRHFINPQNNQIYGYDDDQAGLITKAIENNYVEIEDIKRYMEEKEKQLMDNYIENMTYSDKRRAEYPPLFDYIDGIVNSDPEQIKAYIDACLAVKAKYPKT